METGMEDWRLMRRPVGSITMQSLRDEKSERLNDDNVTVDTDNHLSLPTYGHIPPQWVQSSGPLSYRLPPCLPPLSSGPQNLEPWKQAWTHMPTAIPNSVDMNSLTSFPHSRAPEIPIRGPPKRYVCEWQGCHHMGDFGREAELMRHIKRAHLHSGTFQCPNCSRSFNRADYLREHRRRRHQGSDNSPEERRAGEVYDFQDRHVSPKQYKCLRCERFFNRSDDLNEHIQKRHRENDLSGIANKISDACAMEPRMEVEPQNERPPHTLDRSETPGGSTSDSEESLDSGSSEDWVVMSDSSRLPMFSVIFAKFFTSFLTRQNTAQDTGGAGTSRSPTESKSSNVPRPKTGKRPQIPDSDGAEGEEGCDVPRLTKKQKEREGSQMLLACPFWKKDSQAHLSCRAYKRISDVKQHLRRNHKPLWRCHRCAEIFQAEDDLNSHMFDGPRCPKRDAVRLELSHAQLNSLHKKSKTGSSEEEQWYAIWEIIFPGFQRPSSPYIDKSLSQDLSEYREFCESMTNGPYILATVLEESGLFGVNEARQNDYLQAALYTGLERIFETWLEGRRGESSSPSDLNSNPTRDTEVNQAQTSSSMLPPKMGGTEGEGEDEVSWESELLNLDGNTNHTNSTEAIQVQSSSSALPPTIYSTEAEVEGGFSWEDVLNFDETFDYSGPSN